MKNKLILLIVIFFLVIFLGEDLNPFSSSFFTFHDETQPARIEQFVKELKKFHLPPRIASDMNFGVGYPLFNFYAPFSYFLTSLFHLFGFSIINSLKISFLLAIVLAFYWTFKLLNLFFNFFPSIIGGILYITCLYFPLNIFVRGNLAETWFLSLFPYGIYLIIKTSKNNKFDKKIFLTNSLFLSFIITSHNIYSLFFILFSIILIIFIKKNWQKNFIQLFISILLSAYFYLPLFLELKFTWAKEVAVLTNYQIHFLCPNQLWDSPWGFGGSSNGCYEDGMSFKIGKIPLILFVFGFFLTIINIFKKNKNSVLSYSLLFIVYSLFLLFLTTYQSFFIWRLFEPILKIVQFPWRFIGPSLIGIVFVAVYFLNQWPLTKKFTFSLIIILVILFFNGKYFRGQKIDNKTFQKKYLSPDYIRNKAAYKVAEYLPKSTNYQSWRNLENKKLKKSDLNQLSLTPFSKEKQTRVQNLGNMISLLTIITLVFIPKKLINYQKYGKRN